jgi:Holliday junction resolvase RusA-like endonuclease
MKFSVPLLPPSVNHYKQPRRGGGWYRAADAIAFVDAVCIMARSAGCQRITGNYFELELTFYLGPGRNRGQNDLDNYSKVAIDALVRAGVIKNDARVFDLHLHKRFVGTDREERTEYSIASRQVTEGQLNAAPEETAKA